MNKNSFLAPGQTFQPVEVQPQPQPETERAHLFSLAAGVWLPMTQALMTGAIIGSAAGIYASLLKSDQALKIGAAVGIGAAVIAWILFLVRWLALTRPAKLERITGLDLNQDGYIGAPPPMVKVMVTSEDRRQGIIAEIPYPDRLPKFARGVLSGDPLSERHWSGKGKLFTPEEFKAIRQVFLARGLMRWIDPNLPKSGIELTPYGRAALRGLANGERPPASLSDYESED